MSDTHHDSDGIGAPAFQGAPSGDPRTRATREHAAGRVADTRAWKLLPCYLFGSLLVAVIAAATLGDAGAASWIAVMALLAAVSWWRRATPPPTATRIRLALAWGVLWGALALRVTDLESSVPLLALQMAALGATAFLWSRPRLLAAHLALATVPAVALLLAAGRCGESVLLTAMAALCLLAGQRVARAQLDDALAATARDEAEALVKGLQDLLVTTSTDRDALVDGSDDAIVVVDSAGRIEKLNRVAASLTGALVGERFRDAVPLVEPETRRRAADPVSQCQRHQHPVRVTEHVLLAAGQTRERRVSVQARALVEGRVLVTLRDRTEVHALENLQRLQSSLDPVTGLLNRRELERRFRRLLDTAGAPTHALCCLEVDQVELVNEVCGYPAGDALLHQVALQLAANARADDDVVRLGGGQFALLLPRCNATTAHTVSAKLLDSLQATPFPWRKQRFALTGSVGIATFSGAGTPLADVLSAAVSACHAARDEDTERVHVYREGDATLLRHADLRDWMQRVQQAVESGGFELLAHDIVPVGGCGTQTRHAELLVRMRGEDGALVAPGLFLGAAQRLNLMPAIDRWVIRNALLAMGRENGALADYGFCAINLSGQSLSDGTLRDYVEACLRETGVSPERVCFEITETDVIANLPVAQELMAALRARGCKFALDDFGTGLSSFAYLKQLPADLLKIDGAFVRGLVADPTDRAVVESINQVAHLVGMRTIAEYVQDVATLAALEQLGVDYAQGSLFGEPRPVA